MKELFYHFITTIIVVSLVLFLIAFAVSPLLIGFCLHKYWIMSLFIFSFSFTIAILHLLNIS